ncbi:PAAR domain-containing protein [Nodosilinea sp. E11]|uniref:PAAR domain-containing protein n=1 Tax=Nodosilinea sp. E11 TaxID=3037479 RepID=UPI0029349248|nr:PAAR domain-containing protein [Nodosilinea sp. E11]WOD39720.1 PAAR domain-containing protein [Nodosilinea sp. E11]
MGMPAAIANHLVTAVDTHIVLVPTPGGPVPTPLPHPFVGKLDGGLINTVKINGQPAAVEGSTATNQPAHIPTPPGTSFQQPPANQGTVFMGSLTVQIGGKAAARNGDPVKTCNDPADVPVGQIVAVGTVFWG